MNEKLFVKIKTGNAAMVLMTNNELQPIASMYAPKGGHHKVPLFTLVESDGRYFRCLLKDGVFVPPHNLHQGE